MDEQNNLLSQMETRRLSTLITSRLRGFETRVVEAVTRSPEDEAKQTKTRRYVTYGAAHRLLSHQQTRSHRGINNIVVESRGFVSRVESSDIGL